MPAPPELWSPLDFEHEAFRLGGAEHRRFARGGVRTLHEPLGGVGTSDTVRIDDDTVLTVLNCVLPLPLRWRYSAPEALIMLRASLSCDVTFLLEGAAPLPFNRPEVTLVCLPRGHWQDVEIAAGARQQGLVAVFRGSTFAARHGLRDEDLPPTVREVVTGKPEAGRLASFPLDPRLAALVAGAVDSRLDGEYRVLQLGACLRELVALTLDAIANLPGLRGTTLQRQRDVELAHRALQRLQSEYRNPPMFSALAREVGTNQNKLKVVFKDAFGLTMADYCLQRRMREAQQLLIEARLSVAQIAERVGYEHQSSFTAAFRAHAGMTPREYRRHRAPFSVPIEPILPPAPH